MRVSDGDDGVSVDWVQPDRVELIARLDEASRRGSVNATLKLLELLDSQPERSALDELDGGDELARRRKRA